MRPADGMNERTNERRRRVVVISSGEEHDLVLPACTYLEQKLSFLPSFLPASALIRRQRTDGLPGDGPLRFSSGDSNCLYSRAGGIRPLAGRPLKLDSFIIYMKNVDCIADGGERERKRGEEGAVRGRGTN